MQDKKSILVILGLSAALIATTKLQPRVLKAYAAYCDDIRARPLEENPVTGLRNLEPRTTIERLLFPDCRPQIDLKIIPNNYVSERYTEPYYRIDSYRVIKPKTK